MITREEILRSGVLSIPEALRLAPNLQVTQLTSSEYSNGARGFAGSPDVQNFSNKILILIDGRSVYSPLFSGVVYDMQDVLMDDIDRIEVISGPGATLWGANAMNGVINIITRKAADTQGALVRLDAGAEEQAVGAALRRRIGRRRRVPRVRQMVRPRRHRVRRRRQRRGRLEQVAGGLPHRIRRRRQQSVHACRATTSTPSRISSECRRRRLHRRQRARPLGACRRRVTTRVQVYFDRVDREQPADRHRIRHRHLRLRAAAERGASARGISSIWGLGRRYNDYHTVNNALAFVPDHRTLELTNVFVQDSITLSEELKLTAGIKFEDNSYSDWSALPDLRLSWAPNDTTLFWLAGSRAIRAPTPFDTDVQEFVGGQLFVLGDPDFKTGEGHGVRARLSRQARCAACRFRRACSTTSTTTCAPSRSRR